MSPGSRLNSSSYSYTLTSSSYSELWASEPAHKSEKNCAENGMLSTSQHPLLMHTALLLWEQPGYFHYKLHFTPWMRRAAHSSTAMCEQSQTISPSGLPAERRENARKCHSWPWPGWVWGSWPPGVKPWELTSSCTKDLWSSCGTFLREHRHSMELLHHLELYPSISCWLDFPRTCTGCMHFCKALNSLKMVDQDCEEDYTELFVSADQYERRAGRFWQVL